MSKENFYTEFEEGQTVHCLRQGEGEVVGVQPEKKRPILVLFKNGFHDSYTSGGRNYEEDKHPMLYTFKPAVVPVTKVIDLTG